MDLVTEVNTTL